MFEKLTGNELKGKEGVINLIAHYIGACKHPADVTRMFSKDLAMQMAMQMFGNIKTIAVNNFTKVVTTIVCRNMKSQYNSNIRESLIVALANATAKTIIGKPGELKDQDDEMFIDEIEEDDDPTLHNNSFHKPKLVDALGYLHKQS